MRAAQSVSPPPVPMEVQAETFLGGGSSTQAMGARSGLKVSRAARLCAEGQSA